jgi:hypothetical protein
MLRGFHLQQPPYCEQGTNVFAGEPDEGAQTIVREKS